MTLSSSVLLHDEQVTSGADQGSAAEHDLKDY